MGQDSPQPEGKGGDMSLPAQKNLPSPPKLCPLTPTYRVWLSTLSPAYLHLFFILEFSTSWCCFVFLFIVLFVLLVIH